MRQWKRAVTQVADAEFIQHHLINQYPTERYPFDIEIVGRQDATYVDVQVRSDDGGIDKITRAHPENFAGRYPNPTWIAIVYALAESVPQNVSEIEDQLVQAVLDARAELAAKRGYRDDDMRDAIAEAMEKRRELFLQLWQAAPKRFNEISDVAIWLETRIARREQ